MKTVDEWDKENPQPSRCGVCSLPPELREQVERAKHEKGFGPSRIQKYCADVGVRITVDQLSKHFRKQESDPRGSHTFKVKGK